MADNTIDALSAVEIEQADQALTTDAAFAAADPYKFTTAFRTLGATRLGANSLRAYLEAAGGTPLLAGTSTTPTVNLAQLGPILPGVTYRAWLTGYSADGGEGPAGNVVSFTA